jgi:hypothetical protein
MTLNDSSWLLCSSANAGKKKRDDENLKSYPCIYPSRKLPSILTHYIWPAPKFFQKKATFKSQFSISVHSDMQHGIEVVSSEDRVKS